MSNTRSKINDMIKDGEIDPPGPKPPKSWEDELEDLPPETESITFFDL